MKMYRSLLSKDTYYLTNYPMDEDWYVEILGWDEYYVATLKKFGSKIITLPD